MENSGLNISPKTIRSVVCIFKNFNQELLEFISNNIDSFNYDESKFIKRRKTSTKTIQLRNERNF